MRWTCTIWKSVANFICPLTESQCFWLTKKLPYKWPSSLSVHGLCKHISKSGDELNGKLFLNLGVYHKSFATAKDENGWFHIDKNGNQLYAERYLTIEPFYNGFSLVETLDNKQIVINEKGEVVVNI